MTSDASHPLRVLLAEGNALDRAILARALRQQNHSAYITEVTSLEAAYAALSTHCFDVILIGHQWHDGDAGHLLIQVHTIQQDKPAVIVIGHENDDALAEHYIEAGAQAYLLHEEIHPCSLYCAIAQARQHARQLEALQQEAALLKAQAEHDALTGLYNRRVFDQTLNTCLAQACRYRRQFALLMLDLDQFKQVNDTLGHCAGDALLQQVAGRLCNLIRDSDTACRIGGDEFAILLPEIINPRQPAVLAERLAEALREPVQTGNGNVMVTASIGVAIYPDNGTTTETLMHNADLAMYRSKSRDTFSSSQTCAASDLQDCITTH
jgi:diguanylate cyclase (GGDEF)-like protein